MGRDAQCGSQAWPKEARVATKRAYRIKARANHCADHHPRIRCGGIFITKREQMKSINDAEEQKDCCRSTPSTDIIFILSAKPVSNVTP